MLRRLRNHRTTGKTSHWNLSVVSVRRFDRAGRVARHSSSRAAQEDGDEEEQEDDDAQEEPTEAEEEPESKKSRESLFLPFTAFIQRV